MNMDSVYQKFYDDANENLRRVEGVVDIEVGYELVFITEIKVESYTHDLSLKLHDVEEALMERYPGAKFKFSITETEGQQAKWIR